MSQEQARQLRRQQSDLTAELFINSRTALLESCCGYLLYGSYDVRSKGDRSSARFLQTVVDAIRLELEARLIPAAFE
jgi:hypothetical protein